MASTIINTSDEHCEPVCKYGSNAINLSSFQRKALSIESLAGISTIRDIADRNNVSRKFVYGQKEIAAKALNQAFEPVAEKDEVSSN
jgi:hypothetical protein